MNNFKRARLTQGLTQTELADALGISKVSVCNWELGRSLPKVKRLPEVARILHTTVQDLLDELREARATDGAAS